MIKFDNRDIFLQFSQSFLLYIHSSLSIITLLLPGSCATSCHFDSCSICFFSHRINRFIGTCELLIYLEIYCIRKCLRCWGEWSIVCKTYIIPPLLLEKRHQISVFSIPAFSILPSSALHTLFILNFWPFSKRLSTEWPWTLTSNYL